MQNMYVKNVGGSGGGPWDDREHLQEHGWELGWGSHGVMLCSITYPGWGHHLCRGQRTYVQAAVPAGVRVTTPERGGNQPCKTTTASWDPLRQRVAAVHIHHGTSNYMAGNHCINTLKIDLEPLLPGAPASRSVYFKPSSWFRSGEGTTTTVDIPPGHTLAGLSGFSGDSLDSLGLIIGPHLPPCPDNLADVADPAFLARCPEFFQQQAAALQAALEEVKVGEGVGGALPHDVVAGLVGWLFKVTFYAGLAAAGAAAPAAVAGGDPGNPQQQQQQQEEEETEGETEEDTEEGTAEEEEVEEGEILEEVEDD